jgi:hypothetical protein
MSVRVLTIFGLMQLVILNDSLSEMYHSMLNVLCCSLLGTLLIYLPHGHYLSSSLG